uniref:ATP-dependent Clp protease proteolytic subunit n=1 Tax=Mychonastes jurisii TaxID=797708 RepID=A0A0S2LMR2_MYCJU|nr:proteolytic subunit 2 of clp protease [Mychonastes jurisii]ALO62701.1 proteolytic subunit 2 of clp protease [Mychonastes jurisii]
MPIGVPRIIYCWGEELPAQWTDIYNFIFRRRMVFLMQYLDDELCNQICGLLINIHMEDRTEEMEKKENENNGNGEYPSLQTQDFPDVGVGRAFSKEQLETVMEDLMFSEEELPIDTNYFLERKTMLACTLQYYQDTEKYVRSNEPLYMYMEQLLGLDYPEYPDRFYLDDDDAKLLYELSPSGELQQLLTYFKKYPTKDESLPPGAFPEYIQEAVPLEIYSPFRLLSRFRPRHYTPFHMDAGMRDRLLNRLEQLRRTKDPQNVLMSKFAERDLLNSVSSEQGNRHLSERALTQRQLRRDYDSDHTFFPRATSAPAAYLNTSDEGVYLDYRDYFRKQTERTLLEEETKKVFMMINSFGGSVGNGITVHDALQFIKAGSMTLGLGVAASAASLALAGGTIGDRYITEGCHVMIHQPEGGLSGQASDIWIDSQEIMKIRLDVAEIYSLSTYRPRHKILQDLDRDFYLTAIESIYYGLADEIATNVVMHEIIEMTNQVWDYHDTEQQRLLETRDSETSGLKTQTQN